MLVSAADQGEPRWPLMGPSITRRDVRELVKFLDTSDVPRLTSGEQVKKFERKWAEWLGVSQAVFVNSGSSANDLTFLALADVLGRGEVIVPPLTWVSDISSLIFAGFDPVFADISLENLALSAAEVRSKISTDTRAIFLTHILGLNGLSNELLEVSSENNIPIIEDVCESHGAEFRGRKCGTWGLASNFSFYFAHHMTTIEGGMVCSDDVELIERVRMLRGHGMVREAHGTEIKRRYKLEFPDLNPDFIFAFPGRNNRPTELNAVLGLAQMERLDVNNSIRVKNLKFFLENLDGEKFITDFDLKGNSSYALILVLRQANFQNRDAIESLLRNEGIEFRRGLSGGGNQLRQPYLRNRRDSPAAEIFPVTEHVHHFGWYIGNYPEVDESMIFSLTRKLNDVVAGK